MPGPTGPTGIQGPTGPTGPTGQFGPSGTFVYNLDRLAKKNWYGGFVANVPMLISNNGCIYDGQNLWVCSSDSVGAVYQFRASDGALIQILSDVSYGFDDPHDIAFDGVNLWVTNTNNDSVTAFNATDYSVFMILSGGGYMFSGPDRIIFDGTYLWVANWNVPFSVTRFDTAGGSVMNIVVPDLFNPNDLAFDGTNIWITNQFGGLLDNINIITQAGVFVNSFNNDGFGGAAGLIFDGTIMWTGGLLNNDVVGYSDTAGTVFTTLSGAPYNFNFASAPNHIRNPLTFDGTRVWVSNLGNNTITSFNVYDGSWTNTISGYVSAGYSMTFDGTYVWVSGADSSGNLYNIYV